MAKSNHSETIVVGGGIWGLSIAFHLAKENRRVTVLERNQHFADETTRQSAGQVGQLRSDALLTNAVGYTLELLSNFNAMTGHEPGFVKSGSLHLSMNHDRSQMFSNLATTATKLAVEVRQMENTEIARVAPSVDTSMVDSALWVPNDGYVSAPQFAIALAEAAADRGAELKSDTQVQSIESTNSEVKVLHTNHGQFTCDHLVIASGPWTLRLADQIGMRLPAFPMRLQQARTKFANLPAHYPVVRVPDESSYIRPEKGGFLFGCFEPDPTPIDLRNQPDSFRTADIEPHPSTISSFAERLKGVLPTLQSLGIDEYRQGMITSTPDGKFVIGPLPTTNRIYVATGCGGTGIAASAAVGKWICDWIVREKPDCDLSSYAPNRFEKSIADRDWLLQSCRNTAANYYRLNVTDSNSNQEN